MGDKHSLLTCEEVESTNIQYVINTELIRLGQTKGSHSLVKVLDFGCGRGATVLKLLLQGYEAFGVDVDPGPLGNGAALFRSLGYPSEERLFLCQDNRLPFKSESFDLVFSEEVLEHVSDLDAYAHELARVTSSGGIGIHCFPAKWVVNEPHINVPFVHWLPKNRFRRWWLEQNRSRLPVWHGHDVLTWEQRIYDFYLYLDQKTYYRANASIQSIFREAGFSSYFLGGCLDVWFRNVVFVTRKE